MTPMDEDDSIDEISKVEARIEQLAEAAEQGDMVGAANYDGAVTSGCVACHNHFRGQPGATAYTPRLRK